MVLPILISVAVTPGVSAACARKPATAGSVTAPASVKRLVIMVRPPCVVAAAGEPACPGRGPCWRYYFIHFGVFLADHTVSCSYQQPYRANFADDWREILYCVSRLANYAG